MRESRHSAGAGTREMQMDELVEGQRLLGLRRLTLNNMVQEPAPGNLYEAPAQEYLHDLLPEYQDRFELETNQDLADRSDLAAAIAGVNGPDASFYEDAGQVIDWDEWLNMAAAQAIIADGDGYFGARNNYKLYHELALDRFLVLPWGMDQTFGATDGDSRTYMDYAVDHSSSMNVRSHVFERCQDDATCWARYLDALESLAALFAELPLLAEMHKTCPPCGTLARFVVCSNDASSSPSPWRRLPSRRSRYARGCGVCCVRAEHWGTLVHLERLWWRLHALLRRSRGQQRGSEWPDSSQPPGLGDKGFRLS